MKHNLYYFLKGYAICKLHKKQLGGYFLLLRPRIIFKAKTTFELNNIRLEINVKTNYHKMI